MARQMIQVDPGSGRSYWVDTAGQTHELASRNWNPMGGGYVDDALGVEVDERGRPLGSLSNAPTLKRDPLGGGIDNSAFRVGGYALEDGNPYGTPSINQASLWKNPSGGYSAIGGPGGQVSNLTDAEGNEWATNYDKYSREGGGIFGNKLLDSLGQIAASYFGGPIGSALYTGASGGDLGDMFMSGGMTWLGGQMTGTGSGAAGGDWWSPSGDVNSLGDLFGGGTNNFTTPVGSPAFDQAVSGNMDLGLTSPGQSSYLGEFSSPTMDTGTNAFSGYGEPIDGVNIQALNVENGMPTDVKPPQMLDESAGMSTNISYKPMDGFAKPGMGFEKAPTYDFENRSMFGTPDGTGHSFNAGESPLGKPNLAMDDAGFNFQQKGGGMFNTLKDLWGGSGGNNLMGPLQAGVKLAGGIDSYLNNKKAMGNLENMYSRSMGVSDPQAGNRDFASQKWQQSFNDPESLWKQYLSGPGGMAIQQAAATQAKAGRRNMGPAMMADAKMKFMSDFLPNYQKAINPAQFGNGNGAAVGANFAAPMASMQRNQNAPLYDAVGNIAMGGGFGKLADLWNS